MLGECFQPTLRFGIMKITLFWGEVGGGGGGANRMSQ